MWEFRLICISFRSMVRTVVLASNRPCHCAVDKDSSAGPYKCVGGHTIIEAEINKIMNTSSAMHRRVLANMNLPPGVNKMISVSQFLARCGADMLNLGLDTAELIITSDSNAAMMNRNGRLQESAAKHKGVAVVTSSGSSVVESIPGIPQDTSFISVSDFPRCMNPSQPLCNLAMRSRLDPENECGCILAACITCDGHTTCVMRLMNGSWCIFDPMDSVLRGSLKTRDVVEYIHGRMGMINPMGSCLECDVTIFLDLMDTCVASDDRKVFKRQKKV